jgi:hypothetical protein
MDLPRPGRLVRGTLALLGILFLPLAIWFACDKRHRYWMESAGLFVAGVTFLWAAFKRDSALLDALDGLSNSSD